VIGHRVPPAFLVFPAGAASLTLWGTLPLLETRNGKVSAITHWIATFNFPYAAEKLGANCSVHWG